MYYGVQHRIFIQYRSLPIYWHFNRSKGAEEHLYPLPIMQRRRPKVTSLFDYSPIIDLLGCPLTLFLSIFCRSTVISDFILGSNFSKGKLFGYFGKWSPVTLLRSLLFLTLKSKRLALIRVVRSLHAVFLRRSSRSGLNRDVKYFKHEEAPQVPDLCVINIYQ